MKQTIFLIFVIILFVIGCTRKSEQVNCYSCIRNDSVTSNIAVFLNADSIPVYINPHFVADTGTDCQLTKGQADFFMLQNTKTDTLVNDKDTLEISHWTMVCTVE